MAEVIAVNGDELVLQVRVKLDGSMLNMEEAIQSAVNEVGSLATAEALKRFDSLPGLLETYLLIFGKPCSFQYRYF